MPGEPDPLAERALEQIARDMTGPSGAPLVVSDLAFVARGEVFTVYRGRLADDTPVGVRIVPEHWFSGAPVDEYAAIPPADIIRQEALLSTHCRTHGIPAPEIHGRSLHGDDTTPGLDLIVYQWLEDDGAWAAPAAIGELLRKIHALNPPAFEPVRQRGLSFEQAVARRTRDSLADLQRRTGASFTMPDGETLRIYLGWPDRKTSLLHMGLKPGNLMSVGGQISGVMGWCEALIGPPTFELLSLDERGLLGDSFLGGYSGYDMFHAPAAVEIAFRLASAVRLAEQTLDHGRDDAAVRRAINRIAHLTERFAAESAG
ncbi:MAG: phosphotransferase [Rhodospirillales bacterium]